MDIVYMIHQWDDITGQWFQLDDHEYKSIQACREQLAACMILDRDFGGRFKFVAFGEVEVTI